MVASAVLEMLGLAAEVRLLDLRTGEIRLKKIVLGQQVGVLQPKIFSMRRVFA